MSEDVLYKKEQTEKESEITFKQIFETVKEFFFEVIKKWYFVIFCCILTTIYFIYKHINHIEVFEAELTFMVNEDESSKGFNGIGSVLGTFGLGRSGGNYNLDKILALLNTRKILQNAMFEKVTFEGKNDFLANHFIDVQDLESEWAEYKGKDGVSLKNFKFKQEDTSVFNLSENTVLKFILNKIVGDEIRSIDPLLNSYFREETGIINLIFKSRSEEFSILFLKTVYENLSEFYIEKSIEKQQKSFNIVSAKTDSLNTELRNKEFELANHIDRNRGLFNRRDQLTQARLEIKVKMLSTAYAKVVEQREIAEYALNDRTPVFQVIDYPIEPIIPIRSSLIIKIILGLFFGTFLAVSLIVGRKLFRDALA